MIEGRVIDRNLIRVSYPARNAILTRKVLEESERPFKRKVSLGRWAFASLLESYIFICDAVTPLKAENYFDCSTIRIMTVMKRDVKRKHCVYNRQCNKCFPVANKFWFSRWLRYQEVDCPYTVSWLSMSSGEQSSFLEFVSWHTVAAADRSAMFRSALISVQSVQTRLKSDAHNEKCGESESQWTFCVGGVWFPQSCIRISWPRHGASTRQYSHRDWTHTRNEQTPLHQFILHFESSTVDASAK